MTLHRLLLSLACAVAGALVALPATTRPAAAQAAGCRAFPAPTVTLDVVLAPIQRNDGLSIAQLAGVPGRVPGPAGAAHGHVLGLTQARYGEQSQVGALFQAMGDGSFCAAAKTFTVSFGFQQRVVHVARELPPGSCIHGEVLAHEMKHIAVDEDLLRQFTPLIRRRLDEALSRVAPVRARSQQQAMAAIRRPLEAAMRVTMQEFGRERDRRQALVDTAEEYERVSRVCDGEVRKYLPQQPAPRRRA